MLAYYLYTISTLIMDIVDIKAIYVNHSHFAKSKSKIIVFYDYLDYIALQLLTATHGKMYGTIQQYNGINILYITGLPGLQILLYLLMGHNKIDALMHEERIIRMYI